MGDFIERKTRNDIPIFFIFQLYPQGYGGFGNKFLSLTKRIYLKCGINIISRFNTNSTPKLMGNLITLILGKLSLAPLL